jgi:hypothetical protein
MPTAEALLKKLGEPRSQAWLFERVVEIYTAEELEAVLQQASDIKEAGGEKTLDGSRQRTHGGIFLRLLKTKDPSRFAPVDSEQAKRRRKACQAQLKVAMQGSGLDPVCPIELLGQFIGKGGSSVNTLRTEAASVGCKLFVDAQTGRIRVSGPAEAADRIRANIQENVMLLILKTHKKYSDQVLLSDWMMAGHRGEHKEKWATTLYSWTSLALEHTPASRMTHTFERLALQTPQEVRIEISAQLSMNPAMLCSKEVCSAIETALFNASEASTAPSETLDRHSQGDMLDVAICIETAADTAVSADNTCDTPPRAVSEVLAA